MSAPLKTFIIYARDDEAYKHQLLLHLRPLVVSKLLTVWHDGNILPGEDWEKAIKKELKASELVILLVSVHSLNSDFIQTEELRTALDGLDAGLTRVVPVVVSPCVWKFDPVISRLQALPLSGPDGVMPVSEWKNNNLAWSKVVEQIGDMVIELKEIRIEKERLEQENQQKQKAAEAQAQLDAERAAAEQERLQQQRQEIEKQARIIAERKSAEQVTQKADERISDEKKRIAAEKALNRGQDGFQPTEKSHPSLQSRALFTIIIVAGAVLLGIWFSIGRASDRQGANQNSKQDPTTAQLETPEQAWQFARTKGTLPALRAFRDKYPNNRYVPDAVTMITQLEKDVKVLIKSADLFASEGLKKEAVKKLNTADSISPDDPEVQRRLKNLR